MIKGSILDNIFSIFKNSKIGILNKSFVGKEAIYWDSGCLSKVKVIDFEDTQKFIYLKLMPLDQKCAREGQNDDWEYFDNCHLTSSFNFGGDKKDVKFSNDIFTVPFSGKANFNEFATKHFDNCIMNFELLWYNNPDE
jgi:hypothetical protein